ncbi:hypothetical protein C5167_011954 [Papaver somniferum]|uniref:Uncharacterized protein n=1 Tax=Papaver somniferum TaxID=3469 RepID=A0A4Y7IZG1_PAPSO|nr:hypothetical protein C5167_011954 [Papaver somniferum]
MRCMTYVSTSKNRDLDVSVRRQAIPIIFQDKAMQDPGCSIGIALHVYSTFKVIERKDLVQQKKCLAYWYGMQISFLTSE